MLVRADDPTSDEFLDPNDEAPAQVLCDGYLHFHCEALLPDGPL